MSNPLKSGLVLHRNQKPLKGVHIIGARDNSTLNIGP